MCAEPLRRVAQGDVTLAWCRAHGYLFTGEQWQQFLRRVNPGHEPTHDDATVAGHAPMPCPDCHSTMEVVGSRDPWRATPDVAWHRCATHGVWIPLEATAQLLQRAQLTAARKRRVRDLHEQIRAEGADPHGAIPVAGTGVFDLLQLLMPQ